MTVETMDRYFQTRLTFDKGRTKVWKVLTKIYLALPYHFAAKQMLVIASQAE